MREIEARLLPITRCAECKYFVREGSNGLCLKTKKELPLLHWLTTFDAICPLETKAHNDMVKRREVFLDDQDRQLRKWFDDKKGDREDRRFAHDRIYIWCMVRRCNGMGEA